MCYRGARRLSRFKCPACFGTCFAGTRPPGVPACLALPPPAPSLPLRPSALKRSALLPSLQSRMSEVFGVDIHPAARIGWGVMMDHATGAFAHPPMRVWCRTAGGAARPTLAQPPTALFALNRSSSAGRCSYLAAALHLGPAALPIPAISPACALRLSFPNRRHRDWRDGDRGGQRVHAAPRHPGRLRHRQGRAPPRGRQWRAAGRGRQVGCTAGGMAPCLAVSRWADLCGCGEEGVCVPTCQPAAWAGS